MPDILDGQVDELLCLAEQRLGRSLVPAHPRPSGSVNKPTQAARTAAASQGQLAVRIPQAQAARKDSGKDTAGPNWFNMPKTDLTPELKRDWQLLRMRGLLDPKHQKKALRSTPPEYSHVGEVIAGPVDYYSARLTRKERKRTIFDKVMSGYDGDKLRTKYAGIQRKASSGKKAFYQRLLSQRRKRQN